MESEEHVLIVRDQFDRDFYGLYLRNSRPSSYKICDLHTDALHDLVDSNVHRMIEAATANGKGITVVVNLRIEAT